MNLGVAHSGGRPHVLVVDDERANLALLALTLRNEGYEVSTSPSGGDALERARGQSPDLILLDVLMPGMDGYQVIAALKEDPSTSRIPVIFLSGMEDLSAKLRGFSLGAVDYVTKPFHVEELRARVRIHLQLEHGRKVLVEEQARRLEQLAVAQRMLMVRPEELPQARFGVSHVMREEAGGDFYDVLEPGPGWHGYLIGDASGHDLGTSLVAAGAQVLMRQNAGPLWSPTQTFALVNDALVSWVPSGKFLTAVFASLNRLTGVLQVVSAAHPPALILDSSGTARFLELPGDVLGVFHGARFGATEEVLRPGDKVVLYTDGLVERPDGGVVWSSGLERLRECALDHRTESISDLPARLHADLAEANPSDDVAVLAFEY
ncbi:MAG: fused response regulator/phosphatase [Fibrobacteria bacterium]|nr:fused response regulator/phosphatase [Fibrobacteria bacterium]